MMSMILATFHVSSETAFCLVVVCVVGLALFALLHNVTRRSVQQMNSQHSLADWRATRRQMTLDNAIIHDERAGWAGRR